MKQSRNIAYTILSAIILMFTATGCDDTTGTIGESLIQDKMEIVMDSTFTITGRSVENHKIQSRTVTQLLGNIDADGYGSLSSNYVTQFMSASNIDTVNVSSADIDSLQLVLNIPNGDFIGDSIVPMGLKVYPLVKQLPSPIYSDFDPTGYYDPNTLLSNKIYTYSNVGENDTVQGYTSHYVYATLPKSLAVDLFKAYKANPGNFAIPSLFVKNVFPGIYVETSYGSGRVIRIAQSSLRLHYRKHTTTSDGRDSTYAAIGFYFATKPEVVSNNIIRYNMAPQLNDLLAANKNLIVAPAGRDIEIEFPTLRMMDFYRRNSGKLSVLNTLSFAIPVENITNDYGIAPPPTVMMILSKDKDKFFIDNELNDEVTSFIAQYDETNRCYVFSEMRNYIKEMLEKENVTAEDYTFTITPVSLVTTTEASTSYYYYSTADRVNAIVPFIDTPAMAILDLDKSKIIFTFSKQVASTK
ncbi:MAG: DUF4270 domain-containing protein [Muribaculaceae bacterium]|nr:DUF4270 domain-containing protein [Muribaculaceae bacterium]